LQLLSSNYTPSALSVTRCISSSRLPFAHVTSERRDSDALSDGFYGFVKNIARQ